MRTVARVAALALLLGLLVLTFLATWVAVALLLHLFASPARAAEVDYCRLYTREFARIIVVGSRTKPANVGPADDGLITFVREQAFARCLNLDESPQLPSIPEASDEAWLAAVSPLAGSRPPQLPADRPPLAELGTVPATDPGEAAPAEFAPEWVERCRKEYRTFDPRDGTVIRRGSHGRRVKCPV